jgi:phage shock protein PspC (stress-responsive transcriptional regulator)
MKIESGRPPSVRGRPALTPFFATLGTRSVSLNKRRRRIGGVCAGLADFSGWDLSLIRLLFLGSLLFGGLGLGLYLALWLVLPARPETPIPRVSWALRRTLKRLERQTVKLNRGHDPHLADRVHETFDLIKILAPQLEHDEAGAPLDEPLLQAALVDFPNLLTNLANLPVQRFAWRDDTRTRHPEQLLIERLEALHQRFQKAVEAQTEARLQRLFKAPPPESNSDWSSWKESVGPLYKRLRELKLAETVSLLDSIEEKLKYLLQTPTGAETGFDLLPYEIRKIAFDYLPDALNQYLRLPPDLAREVALEGDKSAEQSLNEQLELLDQTLYELSKSLFRQDASGLLIQGRFLREKFADPPFRPKQPKREPTP